MNVNGDGNGGVDDVNLTVSHGCFLMEQAHKCILEAIGLFSSSKENSRLALDGQTFRLAVHALRRGVLAVRVIELFPTGIFEELARAERSKAEEKTSWEHSASCACDDEHKCGVDGDLLVSDSNNVKKSHGKEWNEDVVNDLRHHLVNITLMCYSVLILYYIAHTKHEAFNFIRALDYCNDVLSFVPGTGTSLFDRDLALLHARHLMENCRFNESEIDETAKICLMLLEEERQKELRDFERMRHLHVSHASCKDKMAFGG